MSTPLFLAGQKVLLTRQRHDAKRAGLHYDYRIVVGDKAYSWATRKELPEPGKSILLFEQPVHDSTYALSKKVVIPDGEYGAGVTTLDFVRKAKVAEGAKENHFSLEYEGQKLTFWKIPPGSNYFQKKMGSKAKDVWMLWNRTPVEKKSAYREEESSLYTHDGYTRSVNSLLETAEKIPRSEAYVKDLAWNLSGSKLDPTRVEAADVSFPIIITDTEKHGKVVLDGTHRLAKALQRGDEKISVKLIKDPNNDLHSDFKPDLTPEQMEALGVLVHKGSQYKDGSPKENFFKVRASMDAWPDSWHNPEHPVGWYQWYQGYAKGKRTADDERQIKRWLSFKARHLAQLRKADPTLSDLTVQPRRRQALLNWGIAPGINVDKEMNNKYMEKISSLTKMAWDSDFESDDRYGISANRATGTIMVADALEKASKDPLVEVHIGGNFPGPKGVEYDLINSKTHPEKFKKALDHIRSVSGNKSKHEHVAGNTMQWHRDYVWAASMPKSHQLSDDYDEFDEKDPKVKILTYLHRNHGL